MSGRVDFGHLELIHNGRVVDRIQSQATGEHFSAELKTMFPVEEPGWLALRVTGQANSEYGLPIFGHTSAIYLEVNGKSIREAHRGGPSEETDSRGEELQWPARPSLPRPRSESGCWTSMIAALRPLTEGLDNRCSSWTFTDPPSSLFRAPCSPTAD